MTSSASQARAATRPSGIDDGAGNLHVTEQIHEFNQSTGEKPMLEIQSSQTDSVTPADGAMSPQPVSKEKAGVAIVDALAAWSKEPISGSVHALRAAKLNANDSIFLAFTTSIVPVNLHYVAAEALRGYTHCSGKNCVLCAIGNRVDQRDLLPVFNVIDQEVQALPVSPNMRPRALRPEMLPVLRQLVSTSRPVLFSVSRIDNQTHRITILTPPDDLDDGGELIAAFVRDFDEGLIDLASVFPRYSEDELRSIEEISRNLRCRKLSA